MLACLHSVLACMSLHTSQGWLERPGHSVLPLCPGPGMWSTQMGFQHLQPSTTKLALTLIPLAACAHVTGIVEHGSCPASMLALLHCTMQADFDRIPFEAPHAMVGGLELVHIDKGPASRS